PYTTLFRSSYSGSGERAAIPGSASARSSTQKNTPAHGSRFGPCTRGESIESIATVRDRALRYFPKWDFSPPQLVAMMAVAPQPTPPAPMPAPSDSDGSLPGAAGEVLAMRKSSWPSSQNSGSAEKSP